MTVSHCFIRQFHPEHLYAPKNVHIQQVSDPQTALFLEIGAGKGKHAIEYAAKNPSHQLIAVERTSEKFAAFKKQADAMRYPNLQSVHADAIAFCVHFIKPNALDGVFLLYPNPEPHNKNQRWLNMPFFEFLISRMKGGAKLVLASNIATYIDEACVQLDDVWRLPYQKRSVDACSSRTHFEIKYLARGELCQEIIITKPSGYRTRFDDFFAVSLA